MTSFSLKNTRDFLNAKEVSRRENHEKLLSQARADLAVILDVITRASEARRVYHWGSLLDGKHFNEGSDIDLAVSGISTETLLRLQKETEALSAFPVHLVRYEQVPESYREMIDRFGKVIYERT